MRRSVDLSQVLDLLIWTSDLYTMCLEIDTSFEKSAAWPKLTSAFALFYNHLLDPSVVIRPGLKKSAVLHARKALRSVGPRSGNIRVANSFKGTNFSIQGQRNPCAVDSKGL